MYVENEKIYTILKNISVFFNLLLIEKETIFFRDFGELNKILFNSNILQVLPTYLKHQKIIFGIFDHSVSSCGRRTVAP